MIQTAFLGDLLLAGVLFREIRRQRPHSDIHLMCRKGFGVLLKALGLVDVIHEVKKGDRSTYEAVRAEIKDLRFEWILCPHPSFRSAHFIQGLQAGQSISFRRYWNQILFSKTVEIPNAPDALRQLSLLLPVLPNLQPRFEKWLKTDWNLANADGILTEIPDELSISARGVLAKSQPVTPISPHTWAIFPGSVWATKQWSEDGFRKVAAELIQADAHVLWMGGPDEAEICERLRAAVPRSRSLAGQTGLFETLVILSRCEGVIANDSGGQHLAATAGTPVLSIFGPTVLEFGFRAWTRWTSVVQKKDLFCRPCGPHGGAQCPRGTHECMTKITPEEVLLHWDQLTRVIRRHPHP